MYSLEKKIFPKYTQSYVNWAYFPSQFRAGLVLEKALNAALLEMTNLTVLYEYFPGQDSYYFQNIILPTRPLPENIAEAFHAIEYNRANINVNREAHLLLARNYCSYFRVYRGHVHLVLVFQEGRSRTETPPPFPRVATREEWTNIGLADNSTDNQAINNINMVQINDFHEAQGQNLKLLDVGRIVERRSGGKEFEFFMFQQQSPNNMQIVNELHGLIMRCTSKLHDRLGEIREVSKSIVAKLDQYESALSFAMFERYKDRVAQIVRITGQGMPQSPTVKDLFDTLLRGLLDIRVPL